MEMKQNRINNTILEYHSNDPMRRPTPGSHKK